MLAYSKNFRETRREDYNKIQRNSVKKRKINDPVYAVKCSIKSLLSVCIKQGYLRKGMKPNQIIGCTIEELKFHLEKQFESWMNWENYGKYNKELNYGWDIDHIVPLSSAKTEEDVYKLNHYTNLQPLCSRINRDIKKNKKWEKKLQ